MMEIKQRYVKCHNEKEWQEYMKTLHSKCNENASNPVPPEFPAIFVEINLGGVYISVPVTLKQFSEG